MISPLGAFLCPPGYAGPTGLRAIARERSALFEGARLARRSVSDLATRRAIPAARRPEDWASEPVVLVPGFMAGDSSLMLMSRFLRRNGYRTYGSTMHANVGCAQDASYALERRIEAISTRRERKVTIVGHSLGGLLARGIAARRPDLVEGAIVMGSPLLAPGAVHPALAFDLAIVLALRRAGLGSMMGKDCSSGECARLSWEESKTPLDKEIAFTSIFSRRDGVVDWRGCLDPEASTVEVNTSHLGMAIDPVVFDLVAKTLRTNAATRLATLAVAPVVSVG